MNFICAIITLFSWGFADLFYKKSADEMDRYSHLKTTMIVGFIMGIHAIITLLFNNTTYNFINILIYLPVSLMYILSMTIGYFGLKYLELSISSPIQNSSGALTCLLCLIFLKQQMTIFSTIGVIFICIGIFMLGVIERNNQNDYKELKQKKYKIGFIAFLIPIIYCLIDSLGTFFDAYYLDDISRTPLVNVTDATLENVANTSYELTFLICSILIFIYITFIKKSRIKIKEQKVRVGAAIFETIGQFTYVYALSGSAVITAPIISAYSIVSIILSRIYLKEKLNIKQYLFILLVIIGIVLIGFSE